MMNETDSKRVKMNDSPENGAVCDQVAPKRVIIDTKTQDFRQIRNFLGFVDHTHFLSNYLSRKNAFAVFAPRKLGKTSLLNMTKTFLEVDCDENGEAHPSVNGPAEVRKNYEIFKDTEITKQSYNKDRVDKHLGKYPVIYLDFKSDDMAIESHEDAVNHFRKVVDKAFKQHEYLRKSEKLKPERKESEVFSQRFEGKRCFDKVYETEKAVTVDLKCLAKYLHKHFGKGVHLLVDNFDSVFVSALCGMKTKNRKEKEVQVKKIIIFMACMLKRFVKTDRKYIEGVVLTGVLDIPFDNYRKFLYNLRRIGVNCSYMITRQKGCCTFFGARGNEVKDILHKLVEGDHLHENFKSKPEYNENGELDESKIMDVINLHYCRQFDDYSSSGVYSSWSVLQFLASGKVEYYWKQSRDFDNYHNILRSKSVSDNILSLMRRGSIWLDYENEECLEDTLNVYDLILNGKLYHNLSSLESSDYLYIFLIEQGFLIGALRNSRVVTDYDFVPNIANYAVTFPNLEIKHAFYEMMPKFVKQVLAFDETRIKQCAETIDAISLSNETELETEMLNIYEHLSKVLNEFEAPRENFEMSAFAVHCVLYDILLNSELFECADPFSQIKTEDHRFVSSAKVDFLIKHKTENFAILWQLKYDKEETSEKTKTSVFAVREAKGEESINNTKNDCLQGLEQIGLNKVVVVGLSVNQKYETSLAYAQKDDPKIFFISNYEYESHKDYYDSVTASQIKTK